MAKQRKRALIDFFYLRRFGFRKVKLRAGILSRARDVKLNRSCGRCVQVFLKFGVTIMCVVKRIIERYVPETAARNVPVACSPPEAKRGKARTPPLKISLNGEEGEGDGTALVPVGLILVTNPRHGNET